VQGTSWADRLELVGDDDRLVGFAGALPLRLLAERLGLRAALTAAMRRAGFAPVYDRGQLLIDLALALILGGETLSDFQGLRHLAPVIGPVPSTSTVWRALAEVGEVQLGRITAALTAFRRHWWALLAAPGRLSLASGCRPRADRDHRGGPGRLGGADRLGEGERRPHLQGRDRVLSQPGHPRQHRRRARHRPAAGQRHGQLRRDNIALLDCAVARLPGRFRHRLLVRLDDRFQGSVVVGDQ
jgi:hypothetical protein